MGASISRRKAVGLIAAGVVLAACRRAPELPAPEAVTRGHDECAWCRMPIDDVRHAAEFARLDGTVEKFGEPGCLLAWLAAQPGARGVSFVTVETGDWVPAADARFLVGAARTPMAFDITAHRSVAATAGPAAAWTELLAKGAPRVRSS